MRRHRTKLAPCDTPTELLRFDPADWSGDPFPDSGMDLRHRTGRGSESHRRLMRQERRWCAARAGWARDYVWPAGGMFTRLAEEQAEHDRVHADLCGCES